MAYELRQELKLSQTLVMTPQLQLAIKLLQLSRLELLDLVTEEIATNPVLDDTVSDAQAPEPAKDEIKEPQAPEAEIDWQAYLESQDNYRARGLDFNYQDDDDGDLMGNISSSEGGLREHLAAQLYHCGLSDVELKVAEFIIGNIDDGGYLRLTERGEGSSDGQYEDAVIDEIVRLTGAAAHDASCALAAVHQLDPAGVGSRTLRECLLIQAAMLPVRDTTVEEIIASHLDELARKNFKSVARKLGITVDEVYDAARFINKHLNPAPGAGFGTDDSRAIVPDIYIHKVGDEYVISLNDDGMPKLKISKYYRDLLKADSRTQNEAKAYIQDRFKSALWLIKSVHQRQRTIYRVVECIVRFQKDFLDKGLKYLKPLVLKDVAESIGVHESTVSRVTSNKYVQTPRGIFELKYFFSNGVGNTDGNDVTSEYIKERLKGIIEAEDPQKPLSDKQIVEALKKSGITVARRTATKYREALGFLSSNRRKTHY